MASEVSNHKDVTYGRNSSPNLSSSQTIKQVGKLFTKIRRVLIYTFTTRLTTGASRHFLK